MSIKFLLFFFPSLLFFHSVISFREVAPDDSSVFTETFHLEGDVTWIVQVSDLHLSRYCPQRADDLIRLLGPSLSVIRPQVVLITGDLTDAKSKDRTSSDQEESEWISYRDSINEMASRSGIDKRRIFDIRGNHDKYGVPYEKHNLDFFSSYSINSQLNRTAKIYNISLLGNGTKYHFLGIDDSIPIGIRRPANLFGHPSDRSMQAIISTLQFDDNYDNAPLTTKIAFGHFPLSFTTSSKGKDQYENVFAEQLVSVYLCGHLHAKLSDKLRWLHSVKLGLNNNNNDNKEKNNVKYFWEWELGDWKDNRFVRILSIDRGAISFLDFKLSSQKLGFETKILITYPIDSRCDAETGLGSLRNDINALVFSSREILNVTARVYDSFRGFKIVEEVPLSRPKSGPLFHAKWNAENYRSEDPTRYWVEVFVKDFEGKQNSSERRPFSLDGKRAIQSIHLLNYFLLGIKWEDLYEILLWLNLGFVISILFLPKIIHYFIDRKNFNYHPFIWYLIEGSRNNKIWICLVIYFVWLIKMPWFWGYATSSNGRIIPMYLSGWRIKDYLKEDLFGEPDIMVIILPFLYLVLSPMVLIIYGLFAERARVYHLHERERKEMKVFSLSWVRKILLVACGFVFLVHFKLISTLMRAYGAGPVALSPAVSWAPPLLLAVSIYTTRTISLS